jgi:hypothetical protein
MKNIGNTEIKDENQFVQNDLIVGNELFVANEISTERIVTSTLSAGGITTGALIASENISIPTLGAITFGINPFKYQVGTFTPTSRCLESDGTTFTLRNWHDSSGQSGSGSYVRYGNMVTVYYQCTVDFGGVLNDFVHSLRIPVISNLPFTCSATGADVIQSNIISSENFPNGYVGGLAAPLTITMDANFAANIYEVGTTFVSRLPPTYLTGASWVSDGRTAIVTCTQSQYSVLGATIFAGLDGPANNFNVVVTGTYTSGFKGSITYFTDE